MQMAIIAEMRKAGSFCCRLCAFLRYVSLQWHSPEQAEHLPEQDEPLGQPMHLTPFFLERYRKNVTSPKIRTITAITIISMAFMTYFFPLSAYSAFTFLSAVTQR